MKFLLAIAALLMVLPAHAAVFKSAATSDQADVNVLVFYIPGKTPKVINPRTGEAGVLSVKKVLGTRDVGSSSAN